MSFEVTRLDALIVVFFVLGLLAFLALVSYPILGERCGYDWEVKLSNVTVQNVTMGEVVLKTKGEVYCHDISVVVLSGAAK